MWQSQLSSGVAPAMMTGRGMRVPRDEHRKTSNDTAHLVQTDHLPFARLW